MTAGRTKLNASDRPTRVVTLGDHTKVLFLYDITEADSLEHGLGAVCKLPGQERVV